MAITAPALFGSRHIVPLLLEFLEHHPALRVRVLFTIRMVHLVDEGFDVALRIAVLPDSGMTVVPVGRMRAVVVALPDYLKVHGVPRKPAYLRQHTAIGLTIEGQTQLDWGFGQRRGVAARPKGGWPTKA